MRFLLHVFDAVKSKACRSSPRQNGALAEAGPSAMVAISWARSCHPNPRGESWVSSRAGMKERASDRSFSPRFPNDVELSHRARPPARLIVIGGFPLLNNLNLDSSKT